MNRTNTIFALLTLFVAGSVWAGPQEDSGIQGGLAVVVGGDVRVALELGKHERFLVQLLDTDPARVQAVRAAIREAGLYGRVSAATFDGESLPYLDNLVNLILVVGGAVAGDEIQRVLAPRGVALGSVLGARYVKPVPNTLDDWSHHLQGPDNNAVAEDTVVSTPRRLQWTCGPLWSRSHEFLSSFPTMVSAGGRVFYVVDEGLPGTTDRPIPERWTLVARDAFNGVLLWKLPLEHWGAEAWGKSALRSIPRSVQSSLVASDNRLFVQLSQSSPLAVLDAATGARLMDLPGTEETQAMRYLDGVLLVRTGGRRLAAIGVESGNMLWQDDGKIGPTFAASDGKAYYLKGNQLLCRNLKRGATTWRREEMTGVTQLLVHEKHLVLVAGKQIKDLEADSGKERWSVPGSSRNPLFVAQGRVWLGLNSLDLLTGQARPPLDPSDVFTPGHHARCYPGKATENYLITPNRGTEFVSLTGGANTQNDWLRGSCTFGIVPCNGLLYAPPNPCFCYPGVKVTGFNACAGGEPEVNQQESHPLEKGPAYGFETSGATARPSDWPQYRQNAGRTGSVATTVEPHLRQQWSVDLGGRLTQPVIASGRAYVVSKDTHTVHALDARTGRGVWSFTAGGRVDSPPALDGGRVLFGCTDGWVYCLRASDGELSWRFRAAPSSRQLVAFSQLESPWRVHGSVLVLEGVVYCTAGRSTNLDGGIWVFGLDAATGSVLHQTRLNTWSRTRTDAAGKPFIPSYHMEGACSDILVSAGGSLYLGQYRFDLALRQQEVPYVPFPDPRQAGAFGREELLDKPYTQGVETLKKEETIQHDWQLNKWPELSRKLNAEYGGSSMGERRFGRHVFSTSGFLDDSYFNRTYWMYSETWPGFYIANRAAKTGQLLCVDAENTYALQAFPRRNLQSPLFTPGDKGYLLFADDNENEPVIPEYTRGVPKGVGFTRKRPPVWFQWIPVRIRAMVAAENALFIAGPPDVLKPDDPMASFEGRLGGELWAASKESGETLAKLKLESPPVFDGLSAASGHLYLTTVSGQVLCYGP